MIALKLFKDGFSNPGITGNSAWTLLARSINGGPNIWFEP